MTAQGGAPAERSSRVRNPGFAVNERFENAEGVARNPGRVDPSIATHAVPR